MQHQRFDSPDPAGRQVVTADGDEIGRVERVIESPESDDDPLYVVDAADAAFLPSDGPLLVSQRAVHVMTEDEIVLGTSTAWLLHDQQTRHTSTD